MTYPERIVPEATSPGIVALHLKRYEFAATWADDAVVLDAGCGVGYGSAHLAQRARRVVGVDRSAEAIEHARSYYSGPNIEYVHADVLSLPLPDASFDLVCAFETIEHLDDPPAFVRVAARVLRAEGFCLVSTPHAAETTTTPTNPHHRIELSAADLERLLRDRFASVQLYGQRRLQTRRHRLAQRADVLGLRKRLPWATRAARLLGTPPMADVGLDQIVIEHANLRGATEIVAVCAEPRR